jgi:molybdopterin converting factor small subunit
MKLFLFGRLRDCAEALHGAEVSADAHNVRQLLDWIAARHPELNVAAQAAGVRFAIDQRFAELDTEISRDSEIALMAPLSGG